VCQGFSLIYFKEYFKFFPEIFYGLEFTHVAPPRQKGGERGGKYGGDTEGDSGY